VGLVKAQVNQNTNEPMNSFRTGTKTETVTVMKELHFGHHCRDIKANDAKCIASRNCQQD